MRHRSRTKIVRGLIFIIGRADYGKRVCEKASDVGTLRNVLTPYVALHIFRSQTQTTESRRIGKRPMSIHQALMHVDIGRFPDASGFYSRVVGLTKLFLRN